MSFVEFDSTMNIFQFLEGFKVGKGDTYTNASMGEPFGSYNIPDDQYDNFFNVYNNAINEGIELHMIEKHRGLSSLLVDLDFKFDKNEITERVITPDHIINILRLYRDEIRNHFNVTDDKLVSCIFMRNAPYIKNNDLKDGIHIIFPYIVSTPDSQLLIRDNVLRLIPEILGDLPIKNTYEDVIDKQVISKNGWMMYGSCKPTYDEYSLMQIFDHNLCSITETEFNPDDIDHTRLFSIRNKIDPTSIREERMQSLVVYNDDIKPKRGRKIKQKHDLTESDIIEIRDLVALLSESRAETENQWIELGWCLHNIDCTNEELLNIWDNFSKKSNKYASGECKKRWDSFPNRKDGISIGSLHYWARADNIEGYTKIKRQSLEYYITRSMSGTEYDIALVLYHMFRNSYVCADYGNNIWYEYESHKWTKSDKGVSLRTKIGEELFQEYCIMMGEYNKKCSLVNEDITDDERDELKSKTKNINKITLKLRTTSFKENIMKEARQLFYNKNFLNRIDTNVYLVCFENGIYDLKKNEFRDGRPDDYLTICNNINYTPYDKDCTIVHEINEFMSQVFVNPEIRKYVWELMSSYLQGHNADELFHLWIGVGSNSKSKLIELFESAIGDYSIKFPITLLTQKRAASNAANPEIAGSKGKRFGSFQEPGQHEKLNVGLMKELTGGDKIKARALYAAPIEFKPQFKLLLVCNHFPDVPGDDEATWRRIRVIEFQSKFVDNPDPENPLEFKRDRYLSEKMCNWTETFMSMLLEHYKSYKANGLGEPDEIMKYTHEYQRKCDTVSEFFEEYADKTDVAEDIIPLSNLYEDYRDWFIDMYSNLKQPSKNDFITYMRKKYHKIIKKGKKKNEFYVFGYMRTDNHSTTQINDDDE
jgi:P4 family phage/plasmid primase-like protien